jgi:diguanylate cyclase (GGDEF)-like protein/PAS domain S-box-containing protein
MRRVWCGVADDDAPVTYGPEREIRSDRAQDKVLEAVLTRYPSALVYALDGAAVRAPVPEHPLFAGCTQLPGTEVSLVDFVVPNDQMTVVRAWESAKATGVGSAIVSLASQPDRPMTYTLADTREWLGVLIGVLVPVDDDAQDAGGPTESPSLEPIRPRTAILHKNLSGIITDLDERTTRMLGWTREEMIGHRSLEFIHPDDHERMIQQWLELRARRSSQRIRARHARRDGAWIWVEVENVFVGLDDPDGLVAIAYLTDISDEMAAHEAVRQREALFTRLTESLPVGVVQITTDQRVAYANSRVSGLLAVPATPTVADLVAAVALRHRKALQGAITAAITEGTDSTLEVDTTLEDQRRRYLITVTALSGQEGVPGAILAINDVTDSARLREELRIKATYDPLTGCLNRASVMAELQALLATPTSSSVAVLFLDLDQFKNINDSYGHAAGDEVLRLTARRLAGQARSTDLIGRLGGDEFLLICPGVLDVAQAREIAQRVHDRVSRPARVGHQQLELSASVGVTLAATGTSPGLLVAQADAAMCRAKRTGTGPILFTSSAGSPDADADAEADADTAVAPQPARRSG